MQTEKIWGAISIVQYSVGEGLDPPGCHGAKNRKGGSRPSPTEIFHRQKVVAFSMGLCYNTLTNAGFVYR